MCIYFFIWSLYHRSNILRPYESTYNCYVKIVDDVNGIGFFGDQEEDKNSVCHSNMNDSKNLINTSTVAIQHVSKASTAESGY